MATESSGALIQLGFESGTRYDSTATITPSKFSDKEILSLLGVIQITLEEDRGHFALPTEPPPIHPPFLYPALWPDPLSVWGEGLPPRWSPWGPSNPSMRERPRPPPLV